MPATGTHSRFTHKQRIATMTRPTHAMHRVLAHMICLSFASWLCQRNQFALPFIRWIHRQGTWRRSIKLLSAGPLVLGSLRWKAGTLGAARVRAIGAYVVSAKGSLAAMALAMDAHDDALLDPLGGLSLTHGGARSSREGRACPFRRLERHAVFGEEGAGFFFADLHVGLSSVDRAFR